MLRLFHGGRAIAMTRRVRGRQAVQNGYLVTIFYSKRNTFRRLFGPPFTIAKGY
jgi:hypothetical protein